MQLWNLGADLPRSYLWLHIWSAREREMRIIENKNRWSFLPHLFLDPIREKKRSFGALSICLFSLEREEKSISCIVLIQTTENSADGKRSRMYFD